MKCPGCGNDVTGDAVFCAKCGAKLPVNYAPSGTPPAASASAPPASSPAGTVNAGPSASGSPAATPASAQFRQTVTAGLTDANDPHHILWEGRYSMKAMANVWFGLGAACIAAIIVHWIWLSQFGATGWIILFIGIALVWLYAYMVYVSRHWGVRYQLTTQRFFHETGVLRHVSERIEVIAMDDITVTQGPLDRLFGTGQIRILSGDHATPDFLITGVADVKHVAEIIDEARRAERNRRGVRVESI